MLHRSLALPILALVLSMLATTEAMGARRTYISATGDDANPCSPLEPCRSFAPAIALTEAGGEVIVRDSAGYGPLVITKSISIIAPPGVYSGLNVFAGSDGVIVAAGASDKVLLRGLRINGHGGNRGIVITSGGEVHIEECAVAVMGQHGIEIQGGGHIHIRSSVVRSNGLDGLHVAGGTPTVHILDSQFVRNSGSGIQLNVGTLDGNRIAASDNVFHGVFLAAPAAGATVVVSISDSVLSGNGQSGAVLQTNAVGSAARMAVSRTTSTNNGFDGFGTYSQGAGTTFLAVADSAALGNGSGLTASGSGATAIVTHSTLAGSSGFDVGQYSSAVLRTSGNNTLTGTGSNTFGSFSGNPLF